MGLARVLLAAGLVVALLLTLHPAGGLDLWDKDIWRQEETTHRVTHLNKLDSRKTSEAEETTHRVCHLNKLDSRKTSEAEETTHRVTHLNKLDSRKTSEAEETTHRVTHLNKLDSRKTSEAEETTHRVTHLNKLGSRKTSEADTEASTTCRMNASACQDPDLVAFHLFRHYISTFAKLFTDKVEERYGNETHWENEFDVRVQLTWDALQTLEMFGQMKDFDKAAVNHVHEALIQMLSSASFPSSESMSWMERKFGFSPTTALLFLLGCCCVVAAVVWLCRMRRWLSRIGIIFCIFLISCVWKWYELYLRELVHKERTLAGNFGQHCGEKTSIFEKFKAFFSTGDSCHDYYHHLILDPFWKVNPMKAVMHVLSESFWTPVQTAGEPFARFLSLLLTDLPFLVWPIAIIFSLVVLFVVLAMVFGRRFKLLYGLIDISAPQERRRQGALTEELEALRYELEMLRAQRAVLPPPSGYLEVGGGDAHSRSSSPGRRPDPGARLGGGGSPGCGAACRDRLCQVDSVGPRHTDSVGPCHTDSVGPRHTDSVEPHPTDSVGLRNGSVWPRRGSGASDGEQARPGMHDVGPRGEDSAETELETTPSEGETEAELDRDTETLPSQLTTVLSQMERKLPVQETNLVLPENYILCV